MTPRLIAVALVVAGCGASEGVNAPAPKIGAAEVVAKESASAAAPPEGKAEGEQARGEQARGEGREARGDDGTSPARPERGLHQTREAKPPVKIGARHVLIQYMGAERAGASVVRTSDQARAVAEEVLVRAKRGEDFARLAVEFSDEPGAANRGGSLGRFGRGQMVPAFDAVAFKLQVNEIALIETPFGFHVVQRTD